MPRVSLVVPVYNVEKYLEQCLRSAMDQTVTDIEIIVVNDGSPDRSQEIIDRLAAEDPRIVPIQQPNGGYGRAVNNGLSRATGDWLFILESDDWLDPFALEVLLDRGERGGYDIVKGGFVREYPDGTSGRYALENLTDRYEGRVRPLANPRVMTMESSIWSAIYRADFIRGNGITMLETTGAAYQDLVWKFLTFTVAENVYFVDYPVYHYRSMAEGSSSKSDRNPLAHFANYAALRADLEARGRFSGDVVGLYWAHSLMDFNFHLGRLSESAKKEFAVAARETVDEVTRYIAEHGGLTSDPEFDGFVRGYTAESVRYVTGASPARMWRSRGQQSAAQRAKGFAKRVVLGVARRAARLSVFRRAVDLYRRSGGAPTSGGTTMIPRISMPHGFAGRNALVLLPWTGENGSMRIIDLVNDSLRDLGYQLHVVAYNNAGGNMRRDNWTYFYDLPHARDFGKMHYVDGELVLDGHKVDDWAGDDLIQMVRSLDDAWDFDVVVCHYVFLSRALEYINRDATRVIVTHDRFAGRNSRFAEADMVESFHFSTTEAEEAKGLRRADHVIALQKSESEYFAGILGDAPTRVHTVPVFDPPQYLPVRERAEGPLRVGYVGSSYINNKTALVNFFSEVPEWDADAIEFVIAGRVCDVLGRHDLPKDVAVHGEVEDLAEFYASVDVVFNPDWFASGRKIKAFEGLSFGLPVLTTVEATQGFDEVPADMRLTSNAQFLERLQQLAADPEALAAARTEARAAYSALYGRYRTETMLEGMIGKAAAED